MTLRAFDGDPNEKFHERIAEKVGSQRYKVWFKDSTSFAMADGFLSVGVANQFVGGWIERNFIREIRGVALELAGKQMEINFAIDPSLAKAVGRKQPDSQVSFASNNPERVARTQKRMGAPPPLPLPRRTFEDFVVGESNRLAYSTALSVSEKPAAQFNPLFIHGGCGIGKTHLLQAICNRVQVTHPDLVFRYMSGEDFTNQYVFAVKTNTLDEFRKQYRRFDVLVIDDAHFFSNKQGTQTEFLHTFNAIDAAGKQVVMASDAHPRMISHLSESLVTRFVSGMVVKIDSPDYQTRVCVLEKRAQKLGKNIPRAVLEYIAERFEANIRELYGALVKLVAMAEVTGQPITKSLAVQALHDLIQRTVRLVRLSDIESVCALYFGLSVADLHTTRKSRTIALARGIAMYLARKHTDMSFPEIGRFMGNKNHSTVLLASRRIGRLVDSDAVVRWITGRGAQQRRIVEIVEEIDNQLTAQPVAV